MKSLRDGGKQRRKHIDNNDYDDYDDSDEAGEAGRWNGVMSQSQTMTNSADMLSSLRVCRRPAATSSSCLALLTTLFAAAR